MDHEVNMDYNMEEYPHQNTKRVDTHGSCDSLLWW